MTGYPWRFDELSGEAGDRRRRPPRQRRAYSVTTPNAGQPITLAELKGYLGIDVDNVDRDTDLTAALKAACRVWEDQTGSALLNQTVTTYWDGPWCWPYIPLPKPLVSAVATVHWFSRANVATVVDAAVYRLSTAREIAPRLVLNDDYEWPIDVRSSESMRVVQQSGWANAVTTPDDVKIALRQMAGMLFDNTGAWEKDPKAEATLAWTPGVKLLSTPYMVVEHLVAR